MFLNDACDYFYDVQYRRERPIPSGTIDLMTVWCFSIGWLSIGTLVLVFLGQTTAVLAVLLLVAIVAYDITHKWINFGPVIMAGCRFLLYLVAGSTAAQGVSGLTVWSAIALALYIVGLSYLARRESSKGPLYAWPSYLLLAPVLLALIANTGGYRLAALFLALLLVLWILWCLRYTFWNPKREVGRTVAGLLAGIVLVDWLAVAGGGWGLSVVFLLLFATALFFQKFIPAT
jgi:4-hydroxybenzoate polyprenyltransferase